MKTKQNIFSRFFGVIVSGKTYRNLLYLFLAFPLGLMYFLFLVIGFSVGFATLIVLVGVALLALVVAGWWGFANLERQMANHLLGESIPPLSSPAASGKGMSEALLAHLSNPLTWKSLLYLFLKFPVGILTFIILALLFSITAFFSTAIITFNFFNLNVELTRDLSWQIDTIGEALLSLPFGILFGFISLHLCNLIARLSGRFASIMLSTPKQIDQQTTITGSGQTTIAPATPTNSISAGSSMPENNTATPQKIDADTSNPSFSDYKIVKEEGVTEIPENFEDRELWLPDDEEKPAEGTED